MAGLVLLASPAVFFVLTARSVFIEATPVTASVEIDGGFSIRMGQRHLIRSGGYHITLRNEGYHDLAARLEVSREQSQTHTFTLRKLPGVVSVETPGLTGATVRIDGSEIGRTPLSAALIEPGPHRMSVTLERYLDFETEIEIEGRSVEQGFSIELEPAWAVVSIKSIPAAEVLVDGEPAGMTPLNLELLQGRRQLMLRRSGYKTWRDYLRITAGEDLALPTVTLEPADGIARISSEPDNASVTLDGEFQGLTPLEVALTPGKNHELSFFSNGYRSARRRITIVSGEERELAVKLEPLTSGVRIVVDPPDAELYVNGERRDLSKQPVQLMAASQLIEIRKAGYVTHSTEFTARPGLEQEIRVTLKSEAQLRRERLQPEITTYAGQRLKLFNPGELTVGGAHPPGTLTMGASRREAGRRPNEVMRQVRLEQLFYMGLNEVTNAQYRLFDPAHTSGTAGGATLNNQQQPVVRVSWGQAARYCNWLSEREGLEPFYIVAENEVMGVNPRGGTGYRLPTEAEWAWAARTDGSGSPLKYPWGGQLPPPQKAGNFADVSARRFLADILTDYNDSHFVSAPVGAFAANHYGLYDMAGNAAEWVHDFYGSTARRDETAVDPQGLNVGQFHVIRGSSWAHGTVTALRLSFRDFGIDGRQDVGFRIARYAEEDGP